MDIEKVKAINTTSIQAKNIEVILDSLTPKGSNLLSGATSPVTTIQKLSNIGRRNRWQNPAIIVGAITAVVAGASIIIDQNALGEANAAYHALAAQESTAEVNQPSSTA